MANTNQFDKDSNAVLDYQINWATWLGADTIATSTWTVESGLTKDSDTKSTTAALIWLSGGTSGQQYVVTNHIVTAAGRTDERSLNIRVVDK